MHPKRCAVTIANDVPPAPGEQWVVGGAAATAAAALSVYSIHLPSVKRHGKSHNVRLSGAVFRTALLMMVSAAACGGGTKGAAHDPPVATARPTIADPYAVPDTIDAAYVNRVLAGLDAVDGDTFRLYLRDRQISPEISERIRALHGSGEGYDIEIRSLEEQKETRFPAVPGNRLSTVARLISASPKCIYAQVVRDYRPVGGTVSDLVAWVGLWPLPALYDPSQVNPTPWRYVVDGFRPDRSEPVNPCTDS